MLAAACGTYEYYSTVYSKLRSDIIHNRLITAVLTVHIVMVEVRLCCCCTPTSGLSVWHFPGNISDLPSFCMYSACRLTDDLMNCLHSVNVHLTAIRQGIPDATNHTRFSGKTDLVLQAMFTPAPSLPLSCHRMCNVSIQARAVTNLVTPHSGSISSSQGFIITMYISYTNFRGKKIREKELNEKLILSNCRN